MQPNAMHRCFLECCDLTGKGWGRGPDLPWKIHLYSKITKNNSLTQLPYPCKHNYYTDPIPTPYRSRS